MNIKKIESGYAASNTYFISKGNKMIVIDPCLNPNNNALALYDAIEGYDVEAILITHAHFDHISGIDAIAQKVHCPVYVHHKEAEWLKDANLNLSTMIPERVSIQTEPISIDLGRLDLPSFSFDVVLTAGHTAYSVSYLIDEYCFSGDFIFKGSVGRMDLPTGSQTTMLESIKEFYNLYKDKNLTLFPGHGPQTTLQDEVHTNPFFKYI